MGDKVSVIDFLAAKQELGNAHSLCLLEDFPALPGQIISQDPKHSFVRECLQRKSESFQPMQINDPSSRFKMNYTTVSNDLKSGQLYTYINLTACMQYW
jgi:hypothetical protein